MTNDHFLYDSFKEKKDLPQNTKYFYGTQIADEYMLKNPKSVPRLGYLARKAMAHYAGATYNPHKTNWWVEELYRLHIDRFIRDRIFYRRKEHDKVYIDNYLKKMTADLFEMDINYDLSIVEKGYSPGFKPPQINELPI